MNEESIQKNIILQSPQEIIQKTDDEKIPKKIIPKTIILPSPQEIIQKVLDEIMTREIKPDNFDESLNPIINTNSGYSSAKSNVCTVCYYNPEHKEEQTIIQCEVCHMKTKHLVLMKELHVQFATKNFANVKIADYSNFIFIHIIQNFIFQNITMLIN